jgi:hypothetical protein
MLGSNSSKAINIVDLLESNKDLEQLFLKYFGTASIYEEDINDGKC